MPGLPVLSLYSNHRNQAWRVRRIHKDALSLGHYCGTTPFLLVTASSTDWFIIIIIIIITTPLRPPARTAKSEPHHKPKPFDLSSTSLLKPRNLETTVVEERKKERVLDMGGMLGVCRGSGVLRLIR